MWLEFVDTDDVASRIEQAASLGVSVNMALVEQHHDRHYLQTACAAAERADVQLTVWPLLTEVDGYWPNQANAASYRSWATRLLGWSDAVCPNLDGIAVDLEPPIAMMESLTADGGLDPVAATEVLLADLDLAEFEAGRAAFADLCTEVHARGLRCKLTTLPFVVDDRLDGDEDIAKALRIPVEGVGWDSLSFQVYRSLFQTYALDDTAEFTSGLVTSYADDIVEFWGSRAAIDLGTTAGGMVEHGGLDSPEAMQQDYAAALGAGIAVDRISLYSLEGLDGHPDPSAWVAVPEPATPRSDAATDDLRGLIQALDLAID